MERIEDYKLDYSYTQTEYEYISSAFSKNGETFVTSNGDNIYRLHKIENPETVHEIKSPDYGCGMIKSTHNQYVYLTTFNTRGILNSLGLFSFYTKSFLNVYHGHTDQIVSIDFSNTNDTFISTARDGTLIYWSHDSVKPVSVLSFPSIPYACFNNDGSKIIAFAQNMIYIFDTRNLCTGEVVKKFEVVKQSDYTKIICSMNDSKLALSSTRGDIVVCENFKSNKINSMKWSTFDSTNRNDAPSIAFSVDSSRLLFATGKHNGVQVYNFEREESENLYCKNPCPIRSIECNLKYPIVATCSTQLNWYSYKP